MTSQFFVLNLILKTAKTGEKFKGLKTFLKGGGRVIPFFLI